MTATKESLIRKIHQTFIGVLLVVCVCRSAIGQTGSGTKAGDSGSTDGTLKREANGGTGKPPADGGLPSPVSRWLLNKNGVPIEIRTGPTYEAFEEFLKLFDENRTRPVGPAPATVTSVKIVGTADEDRANLKVAFTIRVQPEDQFVSVPLFFNEASLRHEAYIGDGECIMHQEKDPEKGFVWWFRGRGQHRLELTLSVPLKKQLPSRSLILTLPLSPISGAQITLPYSQVIAKVLPEQSVIEVKAVGDGATSVEAIGLGSKLNLTWQPNIDALSNEVSLESQTIIRAQIEADHVLIRADQQVKALQGLIERIVVRLPTDAGEIRLDDSEKLTYEIDPKTPQKVRVTLKEKANTAQLNWTLRFPGKLKTLTVDGFFVEGARKHAGKIGLSVAEGLRISEPRDSSLSGITVGEFPTSMGPVVRAYQFFNQPFKLVAAIDEMKPYFQVRPQLQLIASPQQLTLDGDFEFQVDRDSLNEVQLNWPQYKSEGWIIDAIDEPVAIPRGIRIAGVVESYSIDEKGQFTIRLVKHLAGKFSIHVRAHRLTKANEDVAFSLPRPKGASRLSPSTLVVVNAENVETDITAREETAFHLLPSSGLDSISLTESARGLKAAVYRVETDKQLFQVRVIPQKQRIRTESISEAHWQDNQFQIVQRLIYDVTYERLSQIRLTVPAAIDMKRLQFLTSQDSQDVDLIPEILATSGTERQIQLKLGESQLGHFVVRAKFSLPFSKEKAFESDSVLELPILGSSDEPFSQTRFSLAQSDWFDAEPNSRETWYPQLNQKDAWEWKADGMRVKLPLKLVSSTHANEKGNVSAAVIRVTLDGHGDSVVRAQFRLHTRATSLPVVLPPSAVNPEFFWDQDSLTERECVESPSGSRRYSIQLPEQLSGTLSEAHLLTIDYNSHEDSGSVLGWSDRLELRSPQLPNCSWSQVVWQVDLPAGQHLFTYPSSAAPMFRWQRTGLVWSRVSEPGTERLQQWVTAGAKLPPSLREHLVSERNGNLYSFSQFDAPKPLVFQTLSSPMVLLFGAGFSLAAGFVMLRLVVLRHVLTVLIAGLVIATIGLWYTAPLELLIQPMILGSVFPAGAVLLEGWVRRRYHRTMLSFDGPDDFPPLQTFGSHYVVRQSDPNEATVHRPASRESDSRVPIETGSGVS